MELRYVRAFVAVAKHRSFTLAGEELFLTQSAVSQQIRALENELGQTLFVRERNTVELTAAGRALLPEAQQILDAVERARQVVGAPKHLEGALRIATATTASAYLYVGLFERFAHAYPSVRLSIHTGLGHDEAIRRVRAGEADAAFVQSPLDGEGLEHEMLGDTEMLLVAQSGHRIASEKRVKIEAVSNLIVWDLSEEVRRFVEGHPSVHAAVQTNDIDLIKRLVESGFGFGFLPRWALKADLAAGRFAIVDIDAASLRQRFGMTYRGADSSPTLHAFLHACSEYKPVIAELSH